MSHVFSSTVFSQGQLTILLWTEVSELRSIWKEATLISIQLFQCFNYPADSLTQLTVNKSKFPQLQFGLTGTLKYLDSYLSHWSIWSATKSILEHGNNIQDWVIKISSATKTTRSHAARRDTSDLEQLNTIWAKVLGYSLNSSVFCLIAACV